MPTTTNYGWTTPADTDLVKDGASAIRTLGSSIDSTLKTQIDAQIPDSLLTTTGDVIYASGASTPARLGIGSTGQVLTVAAGVPSWSTLSAAENWALQSSAALTGAATITISGISGKGRILVLVQDASTTSTGCDIIVRPNNDASNYTGYGSQFVFSSTYAAGDFTNNTFNSLIVGRTQTLAGGASGYAMLTGCSTSGVKSVIASGFGGAGAGSRFYNHGGIYNSSSAITSISLFTSAGTFDAGTLYVYASA